MLFNIDASVFIVEPPVSYGVLSGTMELADTPSAGDGIALIPPAMETEHRLPDGAPVELIVKRVSHFPTGKIPTLLSIHDLAIRTVSDARIFVAYVCNGFGIHFDPTSPDEQAF